jgi:hypothetical protein
LKERFVSFSVLVRLCFPAAWAEERALVFGFSRGTIAHSKNVSSGIRDVFSYFLVIVRGLAVEARCGYVVEVWGGKLQPLMDTGKSMVGDFGGGERGISHEGRKETKREREGGLTRSRKIRKGARTD